MATSIGDVDVEAEKLHPNSPFSFAASISAPESGVNVIAEPSPPTVSDGPAAWVAAEEGEPEAGAAVLLAGGLGGASAAGALSADPTWSLVAPP